MTPFRLDMIGKPFWNNIFYRKCSLASGGPAVIMADPPKWTYSSVWYKNPCCSNYYQQSSDYNIKDKTFKHFKKVLSKHIISHYFYLKPHVFLQFQYQHFNYVVYHLLQRREMELFFLLLMCWLPILTRASEGN